jgi:hypothetical protein
VRCSVAHFGFAGMLLLALEEVQSLLAAPDLSAEIMFVLALVLSLCSARWPGDDGVVCALCISRLLALSSVFLARISLQRHQACRCQLILATLSSLAALDKYLCRPNSCEHSFQVPISFMFKHLVYQHS